MSPESQSTSSPWFAVSMGLVGLIVGYALATGLGGARFAAAVPQAPTPSVDNNAPAAPTVTADPASPGDGAVLGKADAPVTLIEFTDYQCPFCKRHYEQTFGEIKKNYVDTGKVKYVSRHFPLVSIHPQATAAAEAAECAREQDQAKFWDMHSNLFTNQQEWSGNADADGIFKKYAEKLGLKADQFASCMSSDKYVSAINKDMQDGSNAGIDGTPGFWILGPDGQTKNISGAYPYSTFQQTFDEYLK